MSILTKARILEAIEKKEIEIDVIDLNSIGTESIDLHLGREIKELVCNSKVYISQARAYKEMGYNLIMYDKEKLQYYVECIDPAVPSKYETLRFIEDKILLFPNQLYLAHTIESVGSKFYHPQLSDKSSCMRIALSTHGNAGFGDCGYIGQWTLEIQVLKPTYIYIGMPICQISFETLDGEKSYYGERESSKYQNQTGATESKIHQNF